MTKRDIRDNTWKCIKLNNIMTIRTKVKILGILAILTITTIGGRRRK